MNLHINFINKQIRVYWYMKKIFVLLFAVAACAKSVDNKINTTEQSTAPQIEEQYIKNIHFDFDKYNLKNTEKHALTTQTQYIKTNQCKLITIEGHADERGSREYNLVLSQKRANTVAKELKKNTKCKIKTVGYGKDKPMATGHDEESYAQNRRTETTVE